MESCFFCFVVSSSNLSNFILFILLTFQTLYADDFTTHREIIIINKTDLTFFIDPRPYESSYFISHDDILSKDKPITFKLINDTANANGVISFTLNNGFAFSLFIRDNLVKVYGCKSQPVFFHPEYYFCTVDLSGEKNNTIQLNIQQSFSTS